MKLIFASLATMAMLNLAESPVGTTFPSLKGETINDKTITIPSDTKGKFTVVGLSWSADAEKDLKTWYEPAYDKFIAKTGLMDDAFDVNLYFVPMFTGANAAAAKAAKKQMKETVQADLHPHVLIYAGEIESYQKTLKMDDKKKPYIFLVDKEGKIVYATSGEYTEDKMDAIDGLIE